MNFVKSLLPFAFQQSQEESMKEALNQIQIASNSQIPKEYYQVIFPKTHDQNERFIALLKSLPIAPNAYALIKIFTIIFKRIKEKKYQWETLELLEDIQIPQMPNFDNGENSWICEVATTLKVYLARLPSVQDVYQRALTFKKQKRNCDIYVSDLYRLLNVYSLLFPGLTNCLNIIGRYYLKNSSYISQFYKTMKEEVTLGYDYIQSIVSFFKLQFRGCEISTISQFVQTVPEIELYCDKTQEFLMNKYFKGKGPNKKIYFKEEEITQMTYLIQAAREKDKKSSETVRSTDQQDFGDFQQVKSI